jgi:cell division protein FtsL
LKSKYAVHRPVVNAYLVRERDRRRVRELLAIVVALAPLGAALLVYTWVHLEVLAAGYRVEELERRLHGLDQAERRLRLEASYLAAPERVERQAVGELGMVAPTLDQVVFAAELGRAGTAVASVSSPATAASAATGVRR